MSTAQKKPVSIAERRNAERRGRQRPPPRIVEVVSISNVTPRLKSIHVGGDGLEIFADVAPTSHIKVLFPRAGQSEPMLPVVGPDGLEWPADDMAPVVRTYTPRRFELEAATLEIQFLLHDDGPASDWAGNAKPGDRLAIAGPGGRFNFDPATPRWLIAGDESALPAIGTLLDVMPKSAFAEVHVEVDGIDDEMEFESDATLEVVWHHRRTPNEFGVELIEAVREADTSSFARIWTACESKAVRRIRRHLLEDQGMAPEAIVTRGYWRQGSTNHPDHDYGDDS